MSHQPTSEQAEAVEHFLSGESLKVAAFAGAGKTSTLTQMAAATNDSGRYLAFNKAIALDAKSKFGKNVHCGTTHSLAFAALPAVYKANSSKAFESLRGNRIAEALQLKTLCVSDGVLLTPRSMGFLAAKTVAQFCQSSAIEPGVEHIPKYGKLAFLSGEEREYFSRYLVDVAKHIWGRMQTPTDPLPLGHDGYLKLWSLSEPAFREEFVMLDEAQDTNEVVLSVLRRQKCQVVFVGDRHQQIYEWRGAKNAMEMMETRHETVLTQSFRFGPVIAELASAVLHRLGERKKLVGTASIDSRLQSGRVNTLLCRTNAGVLQSVLAHLKSNGKPHVIGGTAELKKLLEDVGRLKAGFSADSAEFFGFKNWKEVVEFSISEDGEHLSTFVRIVQEIGEVELLAALAASASEESEASLVISTGHKSKGREWDVVQLHSDFVRPMPKPGKKPLAEEDRLLYVALTRAKKGLYLPAGMSLKPESVGLSEGLAGSTSRTEPKFAPIMEVPIIPPMPSLPPGSRFID